ncbi:MAG: 3-methyl-2-oxobutanoate hydroxymethyltransferase [Actinomycetota bacterium]|nr:3-methyl-2-oxobutanoate hydroxymethyltransferase [Actinomycetota bacterium]
MSEAMTVPAVRARKVPSGVGREGIGVEPLVMVTAYDTPTARIADSAGVDLILVGDSVAMVVLGYDDTLHVTVEDMVHHTAAVGRARTRALVIADLPWLSYHLSPEETVRNAGRLLRAGARAVKLEGGRKRLPMVSALVDAEIPVMGHVGLTPQSVHVMGGYRVQAREPEAAEAVVGDAVALAAAGCFAIVVESVPDSVAAAVTEAVAVPTIGIGAGPSCDGQVLVLHDLLGLDDGAAPRFVRRYAHLEADAVAAVAAYATDVRSRRFPSDEETYHLLGDASGSASQPPSEATPLTRSRRGTGDRRAG